MGDDLRREQVVYNPTNDDEALQKAVLGARGNFVAVTDAEGRFNRLINRTLLLERIGAGKTQVGRSEVTPTR
jgi:hypothetical protein